MAESRKSKSPAAPTPVGGVPMLVPAGAYEGKPGLKLAKPVILVGAKGDCHLHLLSSTVSQHHAVILTCSDGVLVRDLASRTRTYINNKPVHEGKLQDGDELKIGKFTFRFDANGFVPGPERVAPDFRIVPDNNDPILLSKRVVVIGRRTTCDIPLVEESCSTTHALLMNMEGRWVVRDLTSRTGTRVNGGAVRVKELLPGDVIRVGETDLRFERVREIEPVVSDEDLDLGGAPASDDLLSLAGEPTRDEQIEVAEPKKVSADDSALELTTPIDLPNDSFAPLPIDDVPADGVAPSKPVDVEALAPVEPEPVEVRARTPLTLDEPVAEVEPRVEARAAEAEPVEDLTPAVEEVAPEVPRPRRGWRAMGLEPGDELPAPVAPSSKAKPVVEEATPVEPVPVETPTFIEPPSALEPPEVVETPGPVETAALLESPAVEPIAPIVEPLAAVVTETVSKGKRKSTKPTTKKPATPKAPAKGRKSKTTSEPVVADGGQPVADSEQVAPGVATPALVVARAAQVVVPPIPVVEAPTPVVAAPAPFAKGPEPVAEAPTPLVEDDIADLLAGPDEPVGELDLSTPAEAPVVDKVDRSKPAKAPVAPVELSESPIEFVDAPIDFVDVSTDLDDASVGLSDAPMELSDSMHPLHVFTDALPKPRADLSPKADAAPKVEPAPAEVPLPAQDDASVDALADDGLEVEPLPADSLVVEKPNDLDAPAAPVVEDAVTSAPSEPAAMALDELAKPDTSDLEEISELEETTDLEETSGPAKSSASPESSDVHDVIVTTPAEDAGTFEVPELDLHADAPVPVADLDHIDFTSPDLSVPDAASEEVDDDDTLPPLASLDELEAEDQPAEPAPTAALELPAPIAEAPVELEDDALVDAVALDAEPDASDIDSTDTVAEVVEPEVLSVEPQALNVEPQAVSVQPAEAPTAFDEDDIDALLQDEDVVEATDAPVEAVGASNEPAKPAESLAPNEIIEPAGPDPDSVALLDDVLAEVETPAELDATGETSGAEVLSEAESLDGVEVVSESDSALTLETGDLADDALLDEDVPADSDTLADVTKAQTDALSDSTLGRELTELTGESTGPLVDTSELDLPVAPVDEADVEEFLLEDVAVPVATDEIARATDDEPTTTQVDAAKASELPVETSAQVIELSAQTVETSAQPVETVAESVSLEESVESYDVITAAASEAGNVTTDIIGAAAATDLIEEDVSGAKSIDLPLPELIDLATLTDDVDTTVAPLDLPPLDASTEELALGELTFDEAPADRQGDLSEVALDPVEVAPEVSTESVGAISASPTTDALDQSPAPVVSTVVQDDQETLDEFEEIQVPAARIIPIEQVPPAAPGTLAAMQSVTVTRPAWDDIPPQLLSFDDEDVAPPAPRQVASSQTPAAPAQPVPAQSEPADTGFDPFAQVGANMEHFLGGVGIDLRAPIEEAAPPPPNFGHVSVAFDAKPGWGPAEPVVGKNGSQNGHAAASDEDDDTDERPTDRATEPQVEQKPKPPRTTRPRAIPFSQKAGPIDASRAIAPAPAPAYSAAPKATSPFDGLAVGSLGTAGAVRQTDVFFNMPTQGGAPASVAPMGAGSAAPATAQANPIPYAGTRVATAPAGRDLSVAPGLPIAPPAGVNAPVAPRRVRRLGVRGLVGLMLVTLAVLCTGIYFLVPYRSVVVATVVYDNFEALGDGDRARFMDDQEKIIGNATTRDLAKKRLAGISPETPAGFLGDAIAFDRLTQPGKMKWNPDAGTLEVTATGDDAEAQRKRLTALLGAVYDANLSFVNDAEGVRKSIEQLRSAIDRSVRDKEDLERQIVDAKRVREEAPDPMRVKALGDEVERLDAEAAQAARKVRDLQAEFDRLTVAPGVAGSSGTTEVAPTDPELVKMRQQLADLNAKLAASREQAVKQTDTAKQSLDAAFDAFNKRVASAQDLMGASPELVRYVTAAQKMQEATKKITSELITSQQESVTQITETRAKFDEINAQRRAERIKNDVELKQMQESLEFNRRKLNAATGSADSQLVDAKTLSDLRGTIAIQEAQIQARQAEVGEDKFDREIAARFESLGAQIQKRMEDNRKKYEGILDGLAKEFASAAPAVEKLSAEQKELYETLSKQGAELDTARKQYSEALGASSGTDQNEIEKVASEVKARIEARATELAEASKKNTASRAELERIKLAEQKQKELSVAKLASASAEVALKRAKDEHWDAEKRTELASTANDRTIEYNDKLKTLTVQLTSQRDAFDAKKKEAARSVAPRKPTSADVVIKENADPRPNWMMGAIAVTCVAYSILIALASHRKAAAPARPVPANGHAMNGNGKPHESPAEEEEPASV